MKTLTATFLSSAIAITLAASLTGCASPGRSSATQTTTSVETLQQRLVTGEQQLDATVAALASLINQPQADLRPQYKRYLDSLKKLEAQIEKGRSDRATMRTRADAYFLKWEQDAQTLQNQELKNVALARRDGVKASFQQISDEFAKAKPGFEDFMRNLHEIQKALDFDLTPGGVAAMKSVVGKAQQQATGVKKNLATIRGELTKVAAQLSANTPTTK